jgi:peptidoglycan/LPS O-acetylase OafA/YrhL
MIQPLLAKVIGLSRMVLLKERAARLLTWLRKPDKGGQIVPQMEGARFIALAAVFFLHFDQALLATQTTVQPLGPFGDLLHLICGVGNFGVQIFFAISGFVLALPFAKQHIQAGRPVVMRQYFMRRLWRLEPPLLISFLILLPLVVWVVPRLTFGEALERTGLSVLYSHYVVLGEMNPVNRVTWSLETEAQFYLAMPIIAYWLKIPQPLFRRVGLIVIALLCMSFKPWLNRALLPAQFEYFVAGILLADLYLTNWKNSLGFSHKWDAFGLLAGLSMLVLLAASDRYYGFGRDLGLAASVFIMLSSMLKGRFLHHLSAGSFVTLVGGMCYSFYLYHDPLLRYSAAALRPILPEAYLARWLVGILSILPVAAIGSLIMYALAERPFMGRRLKN